MTLRDPDHARKIGAFLRARREALSPAEVGLQPAPGRRRAPGLRREEAAQLCGISTTWYTWLEQGRGVACSAATLGRISSSLLLSRAERVYLFELAALKDPDAARQPISDLPPSVAHLPDLMTVPCYVLDALWDMRAANEPARALFSGWLGSGERNLLRYVFLSPDARHFLDHWESSARRVLAEFRADSLHGDAGAVARLVSQLRSQSPDFDRLWHQQAVMMREGGPRRFHHPVGGLLDFEQTTLGFATWPQYRLMILQPAAPKPGACPVSVCAVV